MKAKFGAIITDGRGKLGGHVFQQGRFGSIMKAKTSPIKKESSLQRLNKAILSSLSTSWSNLTDLERDLWNKASLVDKSSTFVHGTSLLSGYNLYVSLNLNLYHSGQSLITSPLPKSIIVPYGITVAVRQITANTLLVFFNSSDYNGSNFILYATPPMSAGISVAGNSFVKLTNFVLPFSNIDVLGFYMNKFGYISEYSSIFLKFKIIASSGQIIHELTTKVVFEP